MGTQHAGGAVRSLCLVALIFWFTACRKAADDGTGNDNGAAGRDDPPVALDPDPPVEYPPALYQQGVEGTVTLRLFVDERGAVVPESTQVAESSGYAEFDSAAVTGIPRMHFAPAQRDGRPIATAFTQPVHFRRPEGGGTAQ